MIRIASWIVACLWALSSSVASAQENGDPEEAPAAAVSRRWAASGGGQKAMFANVAVANLLSQSGMLKDVRSISTNSGSAWFSLQFFFSGAFYNGAVGDTVGEFVAAWMGGYRSMWSSDAYNCSGVPELWSGSFCALISDYGGSWANYTIAMLNAAAVSYGEDASFANRTVLKEAMVDDLAETDLNVIMSLAPNAQVRGEATVYLGSSKEVFTPPIAALFEVTERFGGNFAFALPILPSVATGAAMSGLSVSGYSGFGLASSNDTLTLTTAPPSQLTDNGMMRYPFASAATVGQIAAATSAGAAMFSPVVPSMYAQFASYVASTESAGNSTAYDARVAGFEELFADTTADGLAVCSQYPSACGIGDLYLIDGFFSDETSVALDLGKYQQLNNETVDGVVLKYILVNSNGAYFPILSYFSTDFNSGVAPGDLIWSTDMRQPLPWRSQQIFEDALDMETLMGKAEAVDGLADVTTMLLTATTTNNSAFGVVEGQAVEILVINVNHDIPVALFPPTDLDAATEQLVNMTTSIASSSALLDRIASFYGVEATMAPAGSPTTGGGEPTTPTSSAAKFLPEVWRALPLTCAFALTLL